MVQLYDSAAEKWFGMPRVANGFARCLSEPGYDQVVGHGIRWLHRAMPDSSNYRFWRQHKIESNLISALNICWERHSESVCTDRELQDAFLGLLTALSSRGNHAAMVLKERLLDSIGDG